MLRFTMAILLAVTLAGCTSELNDKRADDNAPQPDARIGQAFDDLPKVLLLSAADAATFESNLAKHNETLRAWLESEKGQRLIELEAEMRVKTREKDLQGLRTVIAQAKPLRDEITAKIASWEEALLDSLGPERRVQWEAHEVSSALLALMEPLGLDPGQQSRIRDKAISQMWAAQSRNEPNPKAASFLELERVAEKDILSPNQQAAYEAIKKDHPMRSLGI